MAVLTQLLSTPVQLQVGEVLGISKELSGLLNDSIKLKSGNLSLQVHSLRVQEEF